MKKLYTLFVFFLTFTAATVSAQETIIGELNYGLLEKYIQSAKQNYPRKKIFDQRIISAQTAIPINTLSYLDIFNANYFYRPNSNGLGTIDPITGSSINTQNGFQFGVSLNLGTFLAKPYTGKRARAEYNISKLEAEEYDNTIELEVKRRYYAYVQQVAQMKINTQTVQDNKNVADGLKYKFEKGEISLDTYNQSRINLANANTAKIQSEVTFLTAKDALEEMVGKPLTDFK
jgi:outer membrane protein TolC